AFLPGSPVHRLFEGTFGKARPRALAWASAYLFCLALAFSLGFALRTYTRASTAILVQPQHQTVVVSAWPKPEDWMEKVFQAALSVEQVRQRLQEAQRDRPVVATILPPKYGMKGMYYAVATILPPKYCMKEGTSAQNGGPLMGVDPDTVKEPVEMVFSRAEKPYRERLALEDALDVDVRLTPLVVVNVNPASGKVTGVQIPLPQNAWGPKVVMPLF
ncbi:MAG: hypothetical protein L0191_18435, partial [Acidobacteria bacterium]|nr:hypothetical protein [Acidobacteriota bacterium]